MTTRQRLTADLNLYVAATGGSDSNSGALTAPFATINHAIDQVANEYDPGGWQMNIRLIADSVNKHPAFRLRNYIDAGAVAQHTNARILGDPAHPELYQVEASSTDAAAALGVEVRAIWSLEGLTLSAPSGGYGVEADNLTNIDLKTIRFGQCGAAHVCAIFGSRIHFISNPGYPLCKVDGSANAFLLANYKGLIMLHPGDVIFGGQSLTDAFVDCQRDSNVYFAATCGGSVYVNKKYRCKYGSGIDGTPAMPDSTQSPYVPSELDLTSYVQ